MVRIGQFIRTIVKMHTRVNLAQKGYQLNFTLFFFRAQTGNSPVTSLLSVRSGVVPGLFSRTERGQRPIPAIWKNRMLNFDRTYRQHRKIKVYVLTFLPGQ